MKRNIICVLLATMLVCLIVAGNYYWHKPRTIKLQWIVSTTTPVQYNIYRAEGNAPFMKIGTSPFPEFVDLTPEPGHTYRYYTRAEDVYGHESQPSNAVIVTLP